MKIRKWAFVFMLGVAVTSLLASCATNRKCNGKRGVRTNMGVM